MVFLSAILLSALGRLSLHGDTAEACEGLTLAGPDVYNKSKKDDQR